jgi:hypothetical protein
MPEFNHDVEIDISPWEYVRECSDSEIKELLEEIRDKGYNIPNGIFRDTHKLSVREIEFEDAIEKINLNYLRLSYEQEEYILNLSKSL